MLNLNCILFELLQIAVGTREAMSRTASEEEWEQIYEMVKKQALVGVIFAVVERLPQEQLPPGRRIRQWAIKADKIKQDNERISKECAALCHSFEKHGFNAVILKGQSNYEYYPDYLRHCREAGDIDVWCRPAQSTKHPVRDVIEYCLSVRKGAYVYYHNLDFPILKKTPVEVHYRPTWLYNPVRNKRLQQWFATQTAVKQYGNYNVATVEFNVIFQLLHVYKHIFEEGIGLRQLLDYYFVLQAYHAVATPKNLASVNTRIVEFGLKRFAGAVMYVMQTVFAMPDGCLLCPADAVAGEQLLSEIIISGNFGHHDERYEWSKAAPDTKNFHGFSYAFMRLKHNLTFLRSYPEEVLFELPFRVYHYFWRTFRLWRY